MKIVHIAPNAPYNEGWGYQENLLTKYQVKQGHEVTLIIRNEMHQGSELVETKCEDYFSNNGFRVIREKSHSGVFPKFCEKMKVYNTLRELKPDFVFYHGLVSPTIFDVCKYKRKDNLNCVIVQDNHLDYNIGMQSKTFKQKVLRTYYRMIFKLTKKYVSKVYGVTPWRKQYAEDYFKVPSKMTDVLIMGADDEKINFMNRDNIRRKVREKYGISDDDFLIITGGKIDAKKKIHLLIEAVNCIQDPRVKLLVFGNIMDDIKEKFKRLANTDDKIKYVGWLDADCVYNYFFASDLVFFPGQHSVLWEQACASKVPCVFEKWEGMDHVDNGGNSDFVENVSVDSISNKINELLFTLKYNKMKEIALSDKTDVYLYSKIAEKSLEMYSSV